MTPLQPRDDRPADRDDRASAQPDDEAQLALLIHDVECYEAMQHLAECRKCRAHLVAFALEGVVDEMNIDQLGEYMRSLRPHVP